MKSNIKIIAIALISVVVIASAVVLFLFVQRSRTVEIASFFSDVQERKALAGLAEDFKKKNKEFDVKLRFFEKAGFDMNRLLSGPDSPDVVTWYTGYELRELAGQKLIEPLDSYVAAEELARNFPQGFLRASSANEKLYLLPVTWTWWAVYYNKSVFKAARLAPPTTWEDFVACCKTLEANGIAPFSLAGKDSAVAAAWFTSIDSTMNGWELHRDFASGTIPYTDERIKKAFASLTEFQSIGYFQQNAYSYDLRDAALLMLDGRAGMCLAPSIKIREIVPVERFNEIGYFRLPDPKDRHTYAISANIEGFSMNAKAFNRKGAASFVSYMAKAESQDLLLRPLKIPAANLSAPVPNAEAKWALTTALSASYALQAYEKDVPGMLAEKGLEGFTRIMTAPKDLDEILEGLEALRVEVYMSAREAKAVK